MPDVYLDMKDEPVMNMLYPELARAQHQSHLEEAARARRALLLRKARRAQRDAEAASARARRALSLAASL